jgi:hypothetical protein
MKEAHKQRLYADLVKYCEQIGILPQDKPKLILDRKKYHAFKVANGEPKRAGGYGECNRELQIIFLDAGKRRYHYGVYRKLRKNSNEAEIYKEMIVSMKDTRSGLDPEILPRLFSKFA